MKKWLLGIVLVLLCAVLIALLIPLPSKPVHRARENSSPTFSSNKTEQPIAPRSVSTNALLAEVAVSNSSAPLATSASVRASRNFSPLPPARPLEPTDIAPEVVLENMRLVFRQFSSTFGGNPVGTNLEITKALNGGNPKQTQFIKPDSGLRINSNGELVDAWGTPFFFHQLSAKEMEIHSAGPDRVMWTRDDLVAK
ncbi:MAG: hypothetical protein QOD03_1021 [Verrucomicrobiota bacterium]|jgi:hypothetical protein